MSTFLLKERRVFTRKELKCRIKTHTCILWKVVCVVWITVTKNKLYWCHRYLLVQNANCRPDTKCRLGTKCRLQSGHKMQTENLKSVFIWFVITCHLTTYQASHNCFSMIKFHNYLHYFGIFLAHFLIKIYLNIISSLHIVFSLCVRVGWCDVCTDFTNVIKVDVNEMSLLNI